MRSTPYLVIFLACLALVNAANKTDSEDKDDTKTKMENAVAKDEIIEPDLPMESDSHKDITVTGESGPLVDSSEETETSNDDDDDEVTMTPLPPPSRPTKGPKMAIERKRIHQQQMDMNEKIEDGDRTHPPPKIIGTKMSIPELRKKHQNRINRWRANHKMCEPECQEGHKCYHGECREYPPTCDPECPSGQRCTFSGCRDPPVCHRGCPDEMVCTRRGCRPDPFA